MGPADLDVVEAVQTAEQFGIDEGCTKPLRFGQPKRASGGAISASTRRLASTKRRIWLGTVCGRIWSTRPIAWKVRSDSSSRPTPRG
jgi:hypothetical protein